MFKRSSLILTCFILLSAAFLPPDRGMASGSAISISSDTVNVREGPGLSYSLVKQVNRGEKFTILKEKGDWTQIELSGGKTGWVASWLITNENNTGGAETSIAVAKSSQLRIHSGPGTDFRILGLLNKGQAAQVLDQNENWTKISSPFGDGWVSSELVSIQFKTSKSGSQETNGNGATGTVTASSLSVRSSNSFNAPIVTTVKKGQTFSILEESGNWLKIEYKPGKTGWAADWYFVKSTTDSHPAQAAVNSTVTILQDGSNIRKQPNLQADVISRANEGDTFHVSKIINNWYEIVLKNGFKGYVAGWIVSGDGAEPLVANQGVQSYLRNKTIVLDPGHGGVDNGTTGSGGTLEKDLTLKTAKLLYDKLRAAGANVYMTRSNDTYISLSSRVSLAQSNHAEAFISLHYDSNPDRSVRGSTGYYYYAYQKPLAETVYSSLVSETKLNNRGVQFGDYHVIRENSQKATLIELGYLSNPSEELFLNSGPFQENAASGIFDGLARFFKNN